MIGGAGQGIRGQRTHADQQRVRGGPDGLGDPAESGQRVGRNRGGDLDAVAVVHRREPTVGGTLGGQLAAERIADVLGGPGREGVAHRVVGGRRDGREAPPLAQVAEQLEVPDVHAGSLKGIVMMIRLSCTVR